MILIGFPLSRILTIIMASATVVTSCATVSSELQKKLSSGGKANIMVGFVGGTEKVLEELNQATFATREERLNAVNDRLQNNAKKSQEKVLEFLASQNGVKYNSLWISNQISISDADAALVEKLAQFEEISEIKEEATAHIMGGIQAN